MEITTHKLTSKLFFLVLIFGYIHDSYGSTAQDECSVSESDRSDCGYTGINEDGCTTRGCCWQQSGTANVPWCFHRSSEVEDPVAMDDSTGLLTICGGQLNVTSEVQQFASPGWPVRYPRNQNCTWVLRAATGYVVHVSVAVRIEGPDQDDGTCKYDNIAFSLDGSPINASSPKNCGTTDVDYYSTGNVMQVRFYCDRNREEQGILANFTAVRDYCHSRPCQNGGTCLSREDGASCACTVEYAGRYCQDELTRLDIKTAANVYNRTGIEINAEQRVIVMEMKTCSYGYIDLVGDDGTVYWKIKLKSSSIGYVARTASTYDYLAIYKCNCTTGAMRLSRNFFLAGDPDVVEYYRSFSCNNALPFWFALAPTTLPSIGLGRIPGEYSLLGLNSIGTYRPPANLTLQLRSTYSANWTLYKDINMTVGTCGGSLTADNDVKQFSSPGWPGGYAPNLHCEWIITAPAGHNISMLLNHIRMDTDCKKDSIIVYDGDSRTGSPLGELEYCGLRENVNLTSSSNIVTITFLTDETQEYYGFIASYTSDEDPDDCASDPCLNGGACYDGFRNFSCVCANGYSGRNCSVVSPCSSNPCQNGGTCRVSGTSFTCSCASGHAGTTCTAVNSCSRTLTASAEVQQVASRNYPSSYRSSDRCYYTINAPSGRQVLLSFVTFSTESCCDCLSVYDGTSSSQPRLARYCGSVSSNTFLVSTSGSMYLYFTSDSSVTRQGYLANYTIDSDECESNPCQNGGTCVDGAKSYTCTCTQQFLGTNCEIPDVDDCENNPCQNGGQCDDLRGDYSCNCTDAWTGKNCTSRNYCSPNPCMNEGICTNYINNPIRNFTCRCVNGYRGSTCNESSPCISSPCKNGGTCHPSTTHTNGYYCSCRTGYYGQYNCSIQNGCGASLNVTSDVKRFASPSYPGSYSNYQRCSRILRAPAGKHILVVFDMFSTESCCDCLAFYPGTSTSGTYIKKFCGSSVSTVRSTTNVMTAMFTSDSSVTGRGFLANYTIDEDECESPSAVCQNNGTCQDGVGTYTCLCPTGYRGPACQYDDYCLSSPCQNDGTCINHPTNFTCNCTIGYKGDLCEIEDMIIHVTTQSNGQSLHNILEIKDENMLTFETSCHSGYRSLNFLRSKNPYSTVQYEVQIRSTRVYLRPCRCDRYDNYAVLNSSSCNGTGQFWVAWGYSTLRFGLGLIPGERELVGASFDRNPQTNLFLRLRNEYGYNTNWTIYRKANFSVPRTCGGLLKPLPNVVQQFASPNWPGGYDKDVYCEWILRTQPGQAVFLKFVEFQLQNSTGCKPDHVVLYEGPSDTGRMVGELCGGNGTLAPTRVGEHTDGLFIDHNEFAWVPSFRSVLTATLTSDGSHEEKGFLAEYYSVTVNEPTRLNSTPEVQTLDSPDPSGLDAVATMWEIRSPPGTRINVTLEDFIINHQYEPRFTCEYARVYVHDVHNEEERHWVQCLENRQRDCSNIFCKPTERATIQSTKNFVVVLFAREPQVTSSVKVKFNTVEDGNDCDPNPCRNGGDCVDGSFSHTCSCVQGFTGSECQYSGCNGTLTAGRDSKQLTLSGSVLPSDGPETCTWFITSPASTKVQVTVDTSSTLLDRYCNESGIQYQGNEKSSWEPICKTTDSDYAAVSDYNHMTLWFKNNISGLPDVFPNDTFKFNYVALYDGDDCVGNEDKCLNEGKCIDERFSFSCKCKASYAGPRCEEFDSPHCPDDHKCENGATCLDGKLNYTCQCARGFTGYYCQEVDYCMKEPCRGGATCVNLPFTFECQCPTGLYGHKCQETILRKCGGVLEAKEEVQHFASPGYPIRYQRNLNCVWNITAEEGHFVIVDFDVFKLEDPQPRGICEFDYVTFTGALESSSARMCGTNWNHTRSTSNMLVMTLVTDGNRQLNGFMANYSMVPDYCQSSPCRNGGQCKYAPGGFTCECSQTTTGIYYAGDLCEVEVHSSCGGDLKATKYPQHFVSPGYPNEYQPNKVCTWNIAAKDEGHRIILEFDEGFKLPFSPNCTSDRLDIYDGLDAEENDKVATFCHDEHQTVKSQTPNLKVVLRTFTERELYGIHGKYYSVYDGCASSPCKNGGTCKINKDDDTFDCLCTPAFTGPMCDVKSKCYPVSPCGRFGECEDVAGGTFKCTCVIGYTGDRCDHRHEDKLRKLLVERYSKSVTPASKTFVLRMGLLVQHIYSLDEHKHKLELLVQLKQIWKDEQLEWKPQDNNGQTEVSLSAPDVWTPDISVQNGIQQKSAGVEITISVQNTGEVTSTSLAELSSSCAFHLQWFPYDTQVCEVVFSSSAYDVNKMKLAAINEEETKTISPKLVNTKWKLSKQMVTEGNNLEFSKLTFTLYLKRDGSHHGFIYIFPVVLLAAVAIIYLLLRPIEIVKYIIGVALLIACVVLIIVLGTEIPLSGSSTPVLSIFYVVVFLIVSISLIICALINNLIIKSKSMYHPPHALKKVLLGPCARVLCLPAYMRYDNFGISMKEMGFVNQLHESAEEHSFVDGSNQELSRNESAAPLSGDDEERTGNKSFIRMNSAESEADSKKRLHVWHVIAIAADRLLLLLFIVIILVICIASLVK